MKNAAFSPFYERWIDGLWERNGSPPAEPIDCANCLMVTPPRQAATRDPGPFRNDLKCCTYFPFLPNFTMGALLKEGSEEAKKRLSEAMRTGVTTPLGLFPSEARAALQALVGSRGFGQREDLLCPLFDSATRSCSIWSHRPGVCASYFCVSKRGQEHWKENETRLSVFEWTFAHELLWRLGFTMDETREIEKTGQWYEYAGRKEELYRLCFERAIEVSPSEIEELLGAEPTL